MEQQYLFDSFELDIEEKSEPKKKAKKTIKKASKKTPDQKQSKKDLHLSLFNDFPLFSGIISSEETDENISQNRPEKPSVNVQIKEEPETTGKVPFNVEEKESIGEVEEPEAVAEEEPETLREKPPWSNAFVVEPDFFTDTMSRGLSITPYHLNNYPEEEENPLHNWGSKDEIQELNKSEKTFLKAMRKDKELFRLSYAFAMEYFPGIKCFYFRDYRGIREIFIKEIKKIHISFLFYDHKGGDPFYMPQITFSDEISTSLKLYLPHEFYNEEGLFSLFDMHSSTIYYFNGLNETSEYLIDFFGNSTSMSEEEIIVLSEKVGLGLADGITVELPTNRINYINLEPVPIVEFSERGRKSRISLFFRYIDREFAFRKTATASFISEKTSETTTIVNRNNEFELESFNYLCEVMGEKLVYSDLEFKDGFTFEFSSSVDKMLLKFGEQLISDGVELRRRGTKQKIKMADGFSFKVKKNSDWLDIKTQIKDSEGNLDTPAFESFSPGDSLLKGKNAFYLVRKTDLEKLEQLKNMGMDVNGELSLSSYNLGMVEVLYEEISNRDDDEVRRLGNAISGLRNFDQIEEISSPAGLHADLRHYQQAGLNWLYFLNRYNLNGCLADDMGLGKTIQTLALIMKLKEQGNFEKALIVVPVSTMPNWQDEAAKFTPDLKTLRHFGPGRAKTELELQDEDIILVSFHTLRNDIELFSSMAFTYLILDEAQNIKNASSQIFMSVKLINSVHRLSLTGTPIENNTMDLWSQFDFLNPGLLNSAEQYKRRFARPIEDEGDEKAIELLRKIVFPFILRRKKEDVVKDLPEKEEIIQHIELGFEQRKLYNEIRQYYRDKVQDSVEDNGVGGSQMVIFEALLRLRQVANFPQMVSGEYNHIISAKFELLKDLVKEIIVEDHKILIFSQFVKSLNIIKEFLDLSGINYSFLHGQTRDRAGQIKNFQEEKDTNVFLISLKAGGVGINLTAADYVVLFDPWWNPAIEAQAIARSHRIGQLNKVIAYKFIAKDTVEEKILEMQDRKKMLVEDVVSTESSFFKSLGKDDIVSLFS